MYVLLSMLLIEPDVKFKKNMTKLEIISLINDNIRYTSKTPFRQCKCTPVHCLNVKNKKRVLVHVGVMFVSFA